jgi:Spy/CpxP family protein refolding chaperone
MKRIAKLGLIGTSLLLTAVAIPVVGQNAPDGNNNQQNGQNDRGGNGGNGGRNRGGGNFDPAQIRQRMMDNLKEQLGATDEELQVLQPRIEKVWQLQRDMSGGGRGFFRGNRGAGNNNNNNGNADQPTTPVRERMRELQTLLESKDTPPEQIKSKLAELRDARAKAKEDLTKAQGELRDVLTQRQEAVLVTMGVLE